MELNILVLNCGSSSIKFQVIGQPSERLLAKGSVSEIGGSSSKFVLEYADQKKAEHLEILDHQYGVQKILESLIREDIPGIESMGDIHGVGHRTVHGAEFFTESVKIDSEVMSDLYQTIDFAPLHNPANIKGIEAARRVLANAVHVAVFDTAFHATLPAMAYRYALPKYFYDKHRIRRYGFHGSSHRFVVEEAARFIGLPIGKSRFISAHLGNGSSLAAVWNGQSIDTSMGFTPLEGLIMGTRTGDMDPAVVLSVMGREELSISEMTTLLNKHSGLMGISGITSDMARLIELLPENENAKLAVDMFCYRVRKYIGAYFAALGGADALIFTGGIGENSSYVRESVLQNLECLGMVLDTAKNRERTAGIRDISASSCATRVLVIPTNEELVIARDTYKILKEERNQ